MIVFGFEGGGSKGGGGGSSFVQIFTNTTGARQIIPHNMGKRPKDVTFFNGDTQMLLEYYRGDGGSGSDPLNNIVLYTDQVYTNLEINFI